MIFFPKVLKIDLNTRLHNLFQSRDSIATCKLNLLVTLISLIKKGMIQSFPHIYIENQFQIFIFQKVIFLSYLDCPGSKRNYILYTNFLTMYSKVMKIVAPIATPQPHAV